ncbi:transporter permease [Roseivirga seohaensis subsp. aquiponti]|uniref:Transporter permease n=2 Tax=Roseivirga seohaensis TaxID=1914963 RepID=A0A0L8AGR8_9BACT|nr:transporter permease [Roseivirga seohaensis subsp. aquiponti]
MFKHNLLVSYRNFLRYKSAFFINLIGLSSGLACTLLIYLWVTDEMSVDKFHQLDDRLYQVMLHHEESGTLNTQEDTQAILAEALEQEVPEIEIGLQATPSFWFGKMPVTANEKTIKATGKFAGKEFFEIFSFPLIDGDAKNVLQNPQSIALSEQLAVSLFGDVGKAIGQMVEWQILTFKQDLVVTGVFKDLPANTTEDFDFILPFEIFSNILGEGKHWGNYNALTYVVLTEGTDVEQLNKKLAPFIKEKAPKSNVTPFVRKYSDKYLYSKYENGVQAGGRIEYIRLFSIVSIFILFIACINFMNLSTAKASRRTKEIGVKKAIGARRQTLIWQYLEEAFLMTFISIVCALALVILLLPQFNQITGKQISLEFSTELITILLVIQIFTGFVSGSYPALYLSGIKAVAILKGKVRNSLSELWIRKGLVVFQFALSVLLITSVLVVAKQIEFIQNKNIGYDKENLILFLNEGNLTENEEAFIGQLRNTPGVVNAGRTSHTILNGGNYTTGVHWEGENPEVQTRFGNMPVSYNFIETLGVEIIEGRSFSKDLSTDNTKLIVNEEAVRVMGMTDPIGKSITLWGDEVQIIGVAKNFNFNSLHQPITPMFFKLENENLLNILVRIQPGQEKATIGRVEALYKEYNTDFDFNYTFLDQEYAVQYAAEERVAVLSKYFGGIAIIISCLGIFGLAAFTAEKRSKEIGVRKALGASNSNIVRLLSVDFNQMIGLAILIALPLSYFLLKSWLDEFAYHIDLEIWYFLMAGLAALIIAWLTVGLQTFKAAKANPVKSLRSE